MSYDAKHNLTNGEGNRDGTDDNRSFNHGIEGHSDNPWISDARRRSMRNLLATLFVSAGIPMLTAGDERGRTQHGNNNGYCIDSELTWVDWSDEPWQVALRDDVAALARLRAENPALRPVRFGIDGACTLSATQMSWHSASGAEMQPGEWNDVAVRTLQYLATSTPRARGAEQRPRRRARRRDERRGGSAHRRRRRGLRAPLVERRPPTARRRRAGAHGVDLGPTVVVYRVS